MAPSRHSASLKRLLFPISVFSVLYCLPTAAAYTWSFQNTPQQCKDLTIQIHGDDGVPPYSVLILPSGPTPLAGGVEARRNTEAKSQGQNANITFQLKYPGNSQFVAVVRIHVFFLLLSFSFFPFCVFFLRWAWNSSTAIPTLLYDQFKGALAVHDLNKFTIGLSQQQNDTVCASYTAHPTLTTRNAKFGSTAIVIAFHHYNPLVEPLGPSNTFLT